VDIVSTKAGREIAAKLFRTGKGSWTSRYSKEEHIQFKVDDIVEAFGLTEQETLDLLAEMLGLKVGNGVQLVPK
jgi:hypothetical protein